MNTLKKISAHSPYFFSLLFFFICASSFLFISGNANCFLILNQYHQPILEKVFIGVSYLGDGVFVILVSLLFFIFKKRKEALLIFATYALSGILAQIIKNLIPMPRPLLFFKPEQYNHFIEGVSYANMASFPSGHTTSAFALATTLIFIIKSKKWDILLLILAIGVGFSRIYLGQHFLLDVITGAFLGFISTILILWMYLDTNIFKKKSMID